MKLKCHLSAVLAVTLVNDLPYNPVFNNFILLDTSAVQDVVFYARCLCQVEVLKVAVFENEMEEDYISPSKTHNCI